MGIIQRQAIQSTFFAYAGTIFGFINASILMPKLLSTSEVGLITFVNSTTKITAAIFTLGMPLITQNLFIRYKNPNNNNNGFLSILIFVSCIGAILGVLAFLLFSDTLIKSENNAAKFYTYFTSGWIILFVFRLFFMNLDNYLRMNLRSVLGVFLENVLSKIIFLFGLVGYALGVFQFDEVFWVNILSLSLPVIVIIGFLIIQKEKFFDLKYFKRYKVRAKEIGNLAFFGIIGGIGSSFVLDIDKYMIANHIGLSATGIYSIMILFGMFISLPSNNLKRISTPVIADSWKRKDLANINLIYKKSGLLQMILGVYIFLGIWFCIDYVFDILNYDEAYRSAKNVILFIALAQIIDMATGVNTEIIATSKSFRWNTYFYLALIFIVFTFNLLLIPIYGIEGAALASMLSFLTINTFRFLFLKIRYKLSPFTMEFIYASILGLTFFGGMSLIPTFENNIIGILVNSVLITIAYWSLIYIFKLSPEVNRIFDNIMVRLKIK